MTVTPEQALAEADAADAALKAGNATALTGIPLAHKDIFLPKALKQLLVQNSRQLHLSLRCNCC